MSEAFKKFLKEHSAEDRDKLDGYSLANLGELEPDEKVQAVALLKREVLQNEWGVEALAFLDKQAAVDTLKRGLDIWPEEKSNRAYTTFYWLYKLTGDETYVVRFCECRRYLNVQQSSFQYEVTSFYVHASWMRSVRAVENMLREAVFIETNETALSVAVDALLANYGFTFDDKVTKSQYMSLQKVLNEGRENQKIAVLKQLTHASSSVRKT